MAQSLVTSAATILSHLLSDAFQFLAVHIPVPADKRRGLFPGSRQSALDAKGLALRRLTFLLRLLEDRIYPVTAHLHRVELHDR